MEPRFDDAQLLAEITASPPRHLKRIKAELLFVDETYLLHYQENGKDTYKYLSPDTLREAFNNQPFDSGWLTPEVLRHGSNRYGTWAVLFIRAQRHCLQFDDEQWCLPLPALVFMGHHQSYWLWAIKNTGFSPNAQAFHAPLPNVNASPAGRICWGQNKPPVATLDTIKKAWELFIRSPFTSHYANHKSQQCPHNIIEKLEVLQRRAQQSPRCRYPVSDLVPIGTKETIAGLITAVLESSET